MDPSQHHVTRTTNMPSQGTKNARDVKGDHRITKGPQETKASISTDGSGEGVAPVHKSKLPTASGVRQNGNASKPPKSASRASRPGPQLVVVHASGTETAVKHIGSHDPVANHTSSASHDPVANHTSSASHDSKTNHTSSASHNHSSSRLHNPKMNRSSSALKQSRNGSGNEVTTLGLALQRPPHSNFEEDIEVPHTKGLTLYTEDLHGVQEVTFVTVGSSGFTQDSEFPSVGHGGGSAVWYGEEGISPGEKPPHAKEEIKSMKQSVVEKPKTGSPTKEKSDREAWPPPDPRGTVMESDPRGAVMGSDPRGAVMGSDPRGAVMGSEPKGAVMGSDPRGAVMGSDTRGTVVKSDPRGAVMGSGSLSPTSPNATGLPSQRSHSSPPEVRMRREHRGQQGQSPHTPSHPLPVPNSDNDVFHNEPSHSDSSLEQKSKSSHSDSSPEQKSKSIFKRFSDSFMRTRSKSHTKSVETTSSWYFADTPSSGKSVPLPVAISEQRLDALTEKERKEVVDDMEVIPRAQSLQHLGGPGVKRSEVAVFGGEVEGHAHISLQVLPSTFEATPQQDDLKSTSSPALLRFAKDRKVIRRQSNSMIVTSDTVPSPTDPHVGEHLTTSLEHPATPLTHPEGGVGDVDPGDVGKGPTTTDQKGKRKSFLPNFFHKGKKSSSNVPSVQTIEENVTPNPNAQLTAATKQSPLGVKKSPVTSKTDLATDKSSPVAAKKSVTSHVAAKKSLNSPVAAKRSLNSPVAAKKSLNSPVAAKKSVNSPVSAKKSVNSPVSAKKSVNSPVAAAKSPLTTKGSPAGTKSTLGSSPVAARNSPTATSSLLSPDANKGSPVAAKKSPAGKGSLALPQQAVRKHISAETRSPGSPAQSPTPKRTSAPNLVIKKSPSSSSSSITQHSSKLNSDPASSPVSLDSLQSPVFSSPAQRKRKVGVHGPTSPLTPPSTPFKAPTPLNITVTQCAKAPASSLNSGSHLSNQPVDLDALLGEADIKQGSFEGNGPTNHLANNLTLSPPVSPLPSLMADQLSGASSQHSRQSSGEALIDIDDVPSPTEGASQTPEHRAPTKGGRSISHDKGGASVGGAHPTDFSGVAVGSTKQDKQSMFTSALPPHPPSKRWTSSETASQMSVDNSRLSQSDGSVVRGKKPVEPKSTQKSTLRRSTKGRASVAARSSTKKKLSIKELDNAQPIAKSSISRVKSPDLPLTKDRPKTHSDLTAVKPPAGSAGGSGTLKRSSDTSTLKRGATRASVSASRPSSAATGGRKSAGAKDGHTLSPSHHSMKRVSSGDKPIHRDSTLRLSKSHSSMRAGTLSRVQHVVGGALSQGTLQRTPVHKVSQSTLRKSIRRASDDIDVFDQISAEASVLKNSDHRRLVRPAFRQKPSASHLKMLHDRQSASTDLKATDSTAETPQAAVLDPNLYSTYMSKKKMDPAAIHGLAMKLDLSTVKLKKTGIVDKLTEQAGGEASGEIEATTQAIGDEMNTKHTVFLLMVKGRRFVQTYLVEPSASSMNSGDVFLCVSGKSLYHWVGKSANVIEKARGADIVSRILNRKELNCQANRICTIEEGVDIPDRDSEFWSLLGGKQGVKSSESTHADETYERGVIAATRMYELQGEGNDILFVPIHSNSQQMLKFAMLDTKKIFLLDFVAEVYMWVGRQSPTKLRKKALELAKAHFDSDCKPAVFQHMPTRTSVARQSGRLRKNSLGRQSKHNLNGSMRKTSKDVKPTSRPSWALFARVIEGGESILLREKFSDWPEQGRIIKMKGHEASVKLMVPTPLAELKPADIGKMLKPTAPFEGLRMEGDNIHRGKGNYMVSRSSFACNRVRTLSVTIWVVKEYENVLVPEDRQGVFFSGEGYVIRWAFRITVVKELEGLTPGAGQFAQDKKYQKSLQPPQGSKQPGDEGAPKGGDGSDDSESEGNSNEECRKLLESGGRDRCAYFFWQGNDCTVNEKGASALMTIELDKEKGPQVRVVQGKEPPAFLTLFMGKMVILRGRSESNSLLTSNSSVKMYCVRGQEKDEAFLLELDATSQPLATQLRSRGCYILHNVKSATLTLWLGSKSTPVLRKVAHKAARCLRDRLKTGEIVTVQEGQEAGEFWTSIGGRNCYISLLNDPQSYSFTPRLYELTSTTGEFTASDVLHPARNNCIDAFPFLQDDIYSVVQPAMFLLDAFTEVYVWIGWWPVIENKLLKDANATTGSAYSRWLQDKKLALETALLYSKACGRPKLPPVYLVHAGTEHQSFINLFPFWVINTKVQELNCKDRKPLPQRVEAEEELKKYTRTKFTLEELKKRPLPEGVDPAKLEFYLCDEEFDKIFKMSREEFGQQPIWKKTTLKKQAGLF